MIGFTLDRNKAVNALLYVSNVLGDEADFHKTFKIIYFADQNHLIEYGRPIVGDTYMKMEWGPVPTFMRDLTKGNIPEYKGKFAVESKMIIRPLSEPELDYLSETDIECLDKSIRENRNLSFDDLVKKSHDFAWENAAWPLDYLDVFKSKSENLEMLKYVKANMLNNNISLR